VLAIALAKCLPDARITAADIDPQSVRVAAANARINGVTNRITFVTAAGLFHPELRRRLPFDLVTANILAGPLMHLAPSIAGALKPGGMLLLSGILLPQAPQVIATYRAHGFWLSRHDRITGWSTLTLMRL
jgi:ribosomal protein L11 methyltransferase